MSHNWFIHCNKRTILMEDVGNKGNWLRWVFGTLNFSVSLKLKSFLKNFSGNLHIRFHTYLSLYQHSGLQKHGCEIIAEKKLGLERSC